MNFPVNTVGYIALFTFTGIAFLLVNLTLGYFLRPRLANKEKLEVYECGEPTIGSSFVQFDLRFYVVALLFIIFDVEVAFFYPWAVVFGKATHLMDPNLTVATQTADGVSQLTAAASDTIRELTVTQPSPASAEAVRAAATTLAQFSLYDIAAFFAVLLIGFAYVWKRGDLDWVRALNKDRTASAPPHVAVQKEEPVLTH
jgi:NADH-quinone oxidoreductase subunit A